MGDYTMAHYYFETFLRNYPKSEFVEDITFVSAYCLYKDSPNYLLDQKNTVLAIDELQSFINRYPESPRVEEANGLIDELREKLEKKAYSRAVLYYNMDNFSSAIVAFEVLMKEFPDTKYRAEASFYILKSNYLYALRSVDDKKPKRLEATIQYYANFVDRFAKTKYMKEAEQIYSKSQQLLESIREKQNS
jgi:outer membrane protein assembly factor BamD